MVCIMWNPYHDGNHTAAQQQWHWLLQYNASVDCCSTSKKCPLLLMLCHFACVSVIKTNEIAYFPKSSKTNLWTIYWMWGCFPLILSMNVVGIGDATKQNNIQIRKEFIFCNIFAHVPVCNIFCFSDDNVTFSNVTNFWHYEFKCLYYRQTICSSYIVHVVHIAVFVSTKPDTSSDRTCCSKSFSLIPNVKFREIFFI